MKTLYEHLNESLNDLFTDEIMDVAMTAIDYLYNKGIVDYSEDNLEVIANGKKTPDYQEIINTMLNYKDSMFDGPYKLLKKYPSTKKEDIEKVILNGIKKYYELNF